MLLTLTALSLGASLSANAQSCTPQGDQTTFGKHNIWIGYVYQQTNFTNYNGYVDEGTSSSPNFNEGFGGQQASYATNGCSVSTGNFSVRYKLKQTFPGGTYQITVGSNDGFRLSLDGGATWAIDRWNDQSYTTASVTASLHGSYDMVLEHYTNSNTNQVSFNVSPVVLPITLLKWSATPIGNDQTDLQWQCTDAVNFDHFVIQRSTDGQSFNDVRVIPATQSNSTLIQDYSYTDSYAYSGRLFYRLAMVDLDGTISYSTIVTSVTSSGNTLPTTAIYPTVVESGTIFVESSQAVQGARLEVFDMSGRRIDEQFWAVLEGRQQVALNAGSYGSLAHGSYFVRLSNNQSILAKQIIIVK